MDMDECLGVLSDYDAMTTGSHERFEVCHQTPVWMGDRKPEDDGFLRRDRVPKLEGHAVSSCDHGRRAVPIRNESDRTMNRLALDPQGERDECPLAAFRRRIGPESVRTGFRKRVGELEKTVPEFRMEVIEEGEVLSTPMDKRGADLFGGGTAR